MAFSAYEFTVHLQHTASLSSGTQITLLLLGTRRGDSLNEVKIAFGVGELFDVLDFQASVFVGNDVVDNDRFAGRLNPDQGFYLGGELCMGATLGRVRFRSEHLGYGREGRLSPERL